MIHLLNGTKGSQNSKPISTRENNISSSARRPNSFSPDGANFDRPRKVPMPSILNPEMLFTAKSSKILLTKIKANLSELCDINNMNMSLIKWSGKFVADIMDLCRVELV